MICLILYAANANSYGDLPTNDYCFCGTGPNMDWCFTYVCFKCITYMWVSQAVGFHGLLFFLGTRAN